MVVGVRSRDKLFCLTLSCNKIKLLTTRPQIDIEANQLILAIYLEFEPPVPIDPSLSDRQGLSVVEWVIRHECLEGFIFICAYESGHLILVDFIEPGPNVAHI